MAQHTAQKLKTLTVVKLTTEILITTFGYVMPENWINGCCGLNEYVGDRHLGHTENGHKKTAPRIRFVNHIKTLLESSSNNVKITKIYKKNISNIFRNK